MIDKGDELYYMKYSEIRKLKEYLYELQNKKCPILGIEVEFNDMVVDHQHKSSKLELGENGNGECRGALHKFANTLLGKVENAYVRTGLSKGEVDLPTILRNMADFLENKTCPSGYIHPTEIPKEKPLGKRVFSKIAKLYSEEFPNKKPLEFPKSGKATKQIKTLAYKYNIDLN
jgi:hypothetical protein